MAEKIRNVEVRDVECDERWAFVGKKRKRVRPEDDENLGDAYTFVPIEAYKAGSQHHNECFRGRHSVRYFALVLPDGSRWIRPVQLRDHDDAA